MSERQSLPEEALEPERVPLEVFLDVAAQKAKQMQNIEREIVTMKDRLGEAEDDLNSIFSMIKDGSIVTIEPIGENELKYWDGLDYFEDYPLKSGESFTGARQSSAVSDSEMYLQNFTKGISLHKSDLFKTWMITEIAPPKMD